MYELFLSEYRTYAQDVLAFSLCGAALLWGGGPERVVAVTWLVVFEFGGRLYRGVTGYGIQLVEVDVWMATADFLAGIIWISIALYANRNYIFWIAAMQLLAMTAHVARGVAEAVSPVAYAVMVALPGWLQLLFLMIGLAMHIARKRKHGDYRDWRRGTFLSRFDSRLNDDSHSIVIAEAADATSRKQLK